MRSEVFNVPDQTEWPLFTTIEKVRPQFADGTQIQVAIGGWRNTDGFSKAAKTEKSRKLFAENVQHMIDATGADGKWNTSKGTAKLTRIGVDIDWEYPGSVVLPRFLVFTNKTLEAMVRTTNSTRIRRRLGRSRPTLSCLPQSEQQLAHLRSSQLPCLVWKEI